METGTSKQSATLVVTK